jgi:hypothetical protein
MALGALLAGCGGGGSSGAAGGAPATTARATTTTAPALDVATLHWVRKPGGLPDASNLNGITAWKDSFRAIGVDHVTGGAAIWSSDDGTTWQKLDASPPVFLQAEYPTAIVTDGTRLVIIGYKNDGAAGLPRAWVSTNGRTWKRATGFPAGSVGFFGKAAAGRAGFAGVLETQTATHIATSKDGMHWTAHAIAAGESAPVVKQLVETASGYLAVGNVGNPADAAVWTSARGDTWTRAVSAPLGGAGFQSADAVALGGPGFVVGGVADVGSVEDAAVWTSADGQTWTHVAETPTVFGGANGSGIDNIARVGDELLAVGRASAGASTFGFGVWTSPDGTTWTRRAPDLVVSGGLIPESSGLAVTSKAAVVLTRMEQYDPTSNQFQVKDFGVFVGTAA